MAGAESRERLGLKVFGHIEHVWALLKKQKISDSIVSTLACKIAQRNIHAALHIVASAYACAVPGKFKKHLRLSYAEGSFGKNKITTILITLTLVFKAMERIFMQLSKLWQLRVHAGFRED